MLDCFRIDAAAGWQRVSHTADRGFSADDIDERFRADVALNAIANAVGRRKSLTRLWTQTVLIVTKPKRSKTVFLDFDDKFRSQGIAGEQIALRMPGATVQADDRQDILQVPLKRRGRRRGWVKWHDSLLAMARERFRDLDGCSHRERGVLQPRPETRRHGLRIARQAAITGN